MRTADVMLKAVGWDFTGFLCSFTMPVTEGLKNALAPGPAQVILRNRGACPVWKYIGCPANPSGALFMAVPLTSTQATALCYGHICLLGCLTDRSAIPRMVIWCEHWPAKASSARMPGLPGCCGSTPRQLPLRRTCLGTYITYSPLFCLVSPCVSIMKIFKSVLSWNDFCVCY